MRRPYPFLRWWLLPLVRSRIWTVRGLEFLPTSGSFILAPNHQSWADSAIVAAAIYRRLGCELRFVSQSSKYGFLGAMTIPKTDRGRVLDVAEQVLRAGHAVVIFPEGNSNANPTLREPRTGVARLALRTGLPVIPVGIRGSRGVSMFGAVAWFFSLWRPAHVRLGPPLRFPVTTLTGDDEQLLTTTTDTIMRSVSDLSGKPLAEEERAELRRGFLWFLTWRILRPLVQWRIRTYGAEHLPAHGPFIVAANHNSYFDAPALSMAVFHQTNCQLVYPTKYTVAQTFTRLGGRGLLNVLGMVSLDNTDRAKVLAPAIAELKHGGTIGIFPEGTRNKPSLNPNWQTEMLRGKTGAVRLHLSTQAPIIPTAIRAPQGLSIFETILNSLKVWKFVNVTFGPPVQLPTSTQALETVTKEQLDALTRQLMLALADLSGLQYRH